MEKYANSICLLSKCVYVKYKMIYELGLVSEGIYINCNSVPLSMKIQVPIFGVASVEQRCIVKHFTMSEMLFQILMFRFTFSFIHSRNLHSFTRFHLSWL